MVMHILEAKYVVVDNLVVGLHEGDRLGSLTS